MAESIIQITRVLVKKTIAEFVQDQETIVMLGKAGVDFIQGYHIGRPAELPTLVEMRVSN